MNASKRRKDVSNFIIFLLFAVNIFMGIGYATVDSTALNITGLAESAPISPTYISSVQYSSNNGADLNNCVILDFNRTILHSNITLGSSSSSTITYTITVQNSMDYDQIFTGTTYSTPDFYSNTNITFDLGNLNVGDIIQAHSSKTFTITFKYAGSNTSNPVLDSYIQFEFERSYSITYNVNNGTNNANNPNSFAVSNPVTILDPTRTNCYFDGWYLNSSFTGNPVTSTSGFTSDIVLYAKWLVDINYTLNGGTQPNNQITQFVDPMDPLYDFPLQDATRQYYIFGGWYNAQNTLVESTADLSYSSRNLSATWTLMMEKTTLSNGVFTSNNISGNVNYTSLAASNGDTYTYAGVNKLGTQINTVRVQLTHQKSQGKSEIITCDVYKSYADYQNNTNHYGTVNVNVSKTTPATFNITLTTPIPVDGEFIVLFSNVVPTRGTFSAISIQFNQ